MNNFNTSFCHWPPWFPWTQCSKAKNVGFFIVFRFMFLSFFCVSRDINYFQWKPSIKLEIGIFILAGAIFTILFPMKPTRFSSATSDWREKRRGFIPSKSEQCSLFLLLRAKILRDKTWWLHLLDSLAKYLSIVDHPRNFCQFLC